MGCVLVKLRAAVCSAWQQPGGTAAVCSAPHISTVLAGQLVTGVGYKGIADAQVVYCVQQHLPGTIPGMWLASAWREE